MNGISVIIKRNNKYLMIQQPQSKPFSLQWMAVSGAIEKGETPELAAIREVKEETGLDIEIIKEIVSLPADYKTEKIHFLAAEWKAGEVKPDSREIKDFAWLTYEEILRLNLMNITKEFFTKHFEPF